MEDFDVFKINDNDDDDFPSKQLADSSTVLAMKHKSCLLSQNELHLRKQIEGVRDYMCRTHTRTTRQDNERETSAMNGKQTNFPPSSRCPPCP